MASGEDAERDTQPPVADRIQHQIAASTGVEQAVERMQQQLGMPMTQLAETMSRLQQMGAPSPQFLGAVTRMQLAVMPSGLGVDAGVRDSMRRISEMVSARVQSRTGDVLARIGDLASSGVLDGEVLEQADQELVADDELSTAIDVAAAEVARKNPLISRKKARRLVVAWVYLVWCGGILALALSPAPAVILAILSAAGAGSPLMGTMAGKAFDKLSPSSGDDPC